MERDFDARALLAGTFNFTTCQRSDGSFYGTGGQCRKGTEVSPQDHKKIKEAQAAQDKVWQKMSGPAAAKLDAAARLEMAATVTDVGISEKKYKEIEEEFERRKEEYTERFRNGEITGKEMDEMISKYQFSGDASKAPMMIVGIEGTPPGRTTDPRVHDEHLGEQLARYSMKKPDSGYESNDVDFVLSGKTVETVVPFTKSTADMMTKLSGDSVSAGEALYGTRVAAAELRTLKAPMEGKWPLGDRPGVQNNPELKERIGTRPEYEKRYGEPMSKNLQNRIKESVNGKGEHILLVTSANDPNADALRKEIGSFVNGQKGSRTSSFSYTTSQYGDGTGKGGLEGFKKDRVARVGTIHEIPKPNGKKAYVYDLGVGVSSKWINSPGAEGLASTLVIERQKMQASNFKPKTKNEVEAINQNREFARQRRQGKEPRWLAKGDNIQNLTDANVKRAAKFGGQAGPRAQQELVRRGLAQASAPKPKTTTRSKSNNKTKAPQSPIPAKPKSEPTMAQKEQRKAQLEGLLAKAKADRNSGFIAKLEGMIAAL